MLWRQKAAAPAARVFNSYLSALNLLHLQQRNRQQAKEQLPKLQLLAIQNLWVCEGIMEAVKNCSLGQITNVLFEAGDSVGGICRLEEVRS